MQDVPTTQDPGAGQWLIDPGKSSIGFRTKNFIGMKIEGYFTEINGAVEIADSDVDSSIQVSIPVTGVDTGSRMRDRDLLKKSVFAADQWPNIGFESTDIRHGSDSQFTVTGNLRVRDRTKTVEVTAREAQSGPGERHYTATSRVNPRDFGITHPFIRRDVEVSIDVWLERADG
ncbi:MAG: YceI family protein [Acidimicrobiia bacterium]